MIMVGALLGTCEAVEVNSVMKALEKVLPERYHHLIPVNKQAVELGQSLVAHFAQS